MEFLEIFDRIKARDYFVLQESKSYENKDLCYIWARLCRQRHFKKNERQLESEGWIKVFRDSFDRKTVWYSEKSFITEAQKNTLEQRSLEIDEYWEIV